MPDPSYRVEPAVVVGPAPVLDLTPVCDTSQYADGDVLFDTIELANAVRIPGASAMLMSIHALDEDDQGIAFDLVFLDALKSLGTINGSPSISDANARSIIGRVSIATGDYIDLGGCRIADKLITGMVLKALSTSTSLYVAGITRGGTPTYTASGLKLKFGLIQS